MTYRTTIDSDPLPPLAEGEERFTTKYHETAVLPGSPIVPVEEKHTNPILTQHNLEEHLRVSLSPVYEDDDDKIIQTTEVHSRDPWPRQIRPKVINSSPISITSTETFPAAYVTRTTESSILKKRVDERVEARPNAHIVERVHIAALEPTYRHIQDNEVYIPPTTSYDPHQSHVVRRVLPTETTYKDRFVDQKPIQSRIVRPAATRVQRVVKEPADRLVEESTVMHPVRYESSSDDSIVHECLVVSSPIVEDAIVQQPLRTIVQERFNQPVLKETIICHDPQSIVRRSSSDSSSSTTVVERFEESPVSLVKNALGARLYNDSRFVDTVPIGDYMRTPTSSVSIAAVSPTIFEGITKTRHVYTRHIPKLHALPDRAILQLLTFLSQKEILHARLINRVFDRFITDERTQKDLCLADHMVLNFNVFEREIMPTATMFAILSRMHTELLPYGLLAEHYFDISAQSSTSREIEKDACRVSLRSQVYDHSPSMDLPFQLIILKRKRDLLDETQHLVQANAANALILNSTGLSDGILRTFFNDQTRALNIIHLPKYQEPSRNYERMLNDECLRDSLRRALRICIRRTLHSRETILLPFKDLLIVEHKTVNKKTGLYQVEQKRIEKRGYVPAIPKTLIPMRRRTTLPDYVVEEAHRNKTNLHKRKRFKRFMARHFHRAFGSRHYKYKHKKRQSVITVEDVAATSEEIVEEIVETRDSAPVQRRIIEEVVSSPEEIVQQDIHQTIVNGRVVEKEVKEVIQPAETQVVKKRIIEEVARPVSKIKVVEKKVEEVPATPVTVKRRAYAKEYDNGDVILNEDTLLETPGGRVVNPEHTRLLEKENIRGIHQERHHLVMPL